MDDHDDTRAHAEIAEGIPSSYQISYDGDDEREQTMNGWKSRLRSSRPDAFSKTWHGKIPTSNGGRGQNQAVPTRNAAPDLDTRRTGSVRTMPRQSGLRRPSTVGLSLLNCRLQREQEHLACDVWQDAVPLLID